jgi:hypothetical protein
MVFVVRVLSPVVNPHAPAVAWLMVPLALAYQVVLLLDSLEGIMPMALRSQAALTVAVALPMT